MKQQYFILVLAHSIHGRLRRIHIPHSAVYAVLALAVFGCFSLFGFISSYARMVWKTANYNSLREEVGALRARYANLQNSANETKVQLATLQVFAGEVSLAYGIKRRLEGPSDISAEGRLVPSFPESLSDYNFLKGASLSRGQRLSAMLFRSGNIKPTVWPVNGRLLSHFGRRSDPFSGELIFHTGVDISASTGTPIRAAADGVVIHAESSGAYGKLVIIRHGQFETYYAHMSRIDVVEGHEVRKGEIIGATGATGRVTSPHLHYEVRQGNQPVNPRIFLNNSVMAQNPRTDLPF